MDKTKCKALVPVGVPEKKNDKASFAKYRKKGNPHILFIRMYLVFFFVGACVFACGKWDADILSQKTLSFIVYDATSVSNFCVRFAPLILATFVVYASGFTFYAPLVAFLYSAAIFTLSGICACGIVYSFGASLESFACMLLLGVNCAFCVLFCGSTLGISKITLRGIGKLSISDGLLYTAFFFVVLWIWYVSGKGIFSLVG